MSQCIHESILSYLKDFHIAYLVGLHRLFGILPSVCRLSRPGPLLVAAADGGGPGSL